MSRLFVALQPSPAVRRQLLAIMGGGPGARWQEEAQLHLTLRFIGEVEDRLAEEIALVLRSVRASRPTIVVRGLGVFERNGAVHAVWAGVAPDPGLTALHAAIGATMHSLGPLPADNAFQPHVTLARLGRKAGPVGDFLSAHGALRCEPEQADAFMLYRSILDPAGSIYELEERYALVP